MVHDRTGRSQFEMSDCQQITIDLQRECAETYVNDTFLLG